MRLSADDVTVRAGDATLLDRVNVDVVPGELTVVLGPNGAGKSTLLSTLAGDRPPDGGVVRLAEAPIEDISLQRQAELRAVIGPPAPLAFDFTTADVVAMGWVHGERYGTHACEDALEEVLTRCELTSLRTRVYMTLSSGERQRVQFARGLLQIWRPEGDGTPRWLLLDEPTSNLDIAHAIGLLDTLRKEARGGVGVLAIVHDLDLGVRYGDSIVLLAAGRVIAAGAPETVMTGERLSAVYGTPVCVEHNPGLGRLTVLT